MIDPSTEPSFNDRWQGEPDATWGDRPGIVASLLRYRVIVVAATLLGAVAGLRPRAAASGPLPGRRRLDPLRPRRPDRPRRRQPAGQQRPPGLPGQAGGHHDAPGSCSSVPSRSSEAISRSATVRDELDVHPAANMASISIAATTADPGSAAALGERGRHGLRAGHAGTRRRPTRNGRSPASRSSAHRYQADLDASPRSPDGELTSRQQQLTGQIADLQQREQDITTQVGVYASGVEYFEQAEPPTSPSQPKPKLAAALGGLVGLARGGGVGVVGGSPRPARRGPGRTGPDPRGAAARRGATTPRPAAGDGHGGHAAEARPGPRGCLPPHRRLDGARADRRRRKVDRA